MIEKADQRLKRLTHPPASAIPAKSIPDAKDSRRLNSDAGHRGMDLSRRQLPVIEASSARTTASPSKPIIALALLTGTGLLDFFEPYIPARSLGCEWGDCAA